MLNIRAAYYGLLLTWAGQIYYKIVFNIFKITIMNALASYVIHPILFLIKQ